MNPAPHGMNVHYVRGEWIRWVCSAISEMMFAAYQSIRRILVRIGPRETLALDRLADVGIAYEGESAVRLDVHQHQRPRSRGPSCRNLGWSIVCRLIMGYFVMSLADGFL